MHRFDHIAKFRVDKVMLEVSFEKLGLKCSKIFLTRDELQEYIIALLY